MKYRLLATSVINDQVLEAGTEIGDGTPFKFDGVPGPHMFPLDSDARWAMHEYEESRKSHSIWPSEAGQR